MSAGKRYAPPAQILSLFEPARALWEFSALPLSAPLLFSTPLGDGHPVMVIPGFLGGDNSTLVLRNYLRTRGYDVYPWTLGRNLGPRGQTEKRMIERAVHLAAHHERKVSLIGWSLGGVFARQIAREVPDAVRQVITLGSPFRSPGHGGTNTTITNLYKAISDDPIHEASPEEQARYRRKPPVPVTAIYSKSDGVCVWQVCAEDEGPLTDNIEVMSSHTGLGHHPMVLYIVADRLAQPEDGWKPFERTGLHPRRNGNGSTPR